MKEYRYYLPFNSISDLIWKAKKMLDANKEQTIETKRVLEEKGIPFNQVNDYMLEIDMDKLSEEDIKFVKNSSKGVVHQAYKDNGVIEGNKISIKHK